ncbi:MAG: hypothetical protein EPN93_20935 [Spirochaetes bacterium]|nr:MAG: hypothetical protein EPN93_20935 [Spirochaetota bacterium]
MKTQVDQYRRLEIAGGLSTIIFPFLLLIGFLLHPDILSFDIVEHAEQLVLNFRHQPIFHIGHTIVAFSIPLIVLSVLYVLLVLKGRGARCGFWGGMIALFGAVILALDKGSLCLVLSGFDTLDDAQFAGLIPYLQVLVDKRGLLVINWFIVLLPLGAIIQAIGLVRENFIGRVQGVSVIMGLVLLNNPDIELISTAGVILMMAGYLPLGINILRKGYIGTPSLDA